MRRFSAFFATLFLALTALASAPALAAQASPAAPAAARFAQPRPVPGPDAGEAMVDVGDWWVGGGLGIGTAGLGIGFDVSVEVDGHLVQTRLTAHDNLAGWAADSRTPELVTELGVMYGTRRWFSSGNQATAAAGLALVVGDRNYGEEEFQTVGIPVQAQLISRGPLRLAITGLGNLNLEAPFASFTVSLLLGRIR